MLFNVCRSIAMSVAVNQFTNRACPVAAIIGQAETVAVFLVTMPMPSDDDAEGAMPVLLVLFAPAVPPGFGPSWRHVAGSATNRCPLLSGRLGDQTTEFGAIDAGCEPCPRQPTRTCRLGGNLQNWS